MEHGQDNDAITPDAIINRIRELPDESLADFLVDFDVHFGRC